MLFAFLASAASATVMSSILSFLFSQTPQFLDDPMLVSIYDLKVRANISDHFSMNYRTLPSEMRVTSTLSRLKVSMMTQ